MMSWMDDSLMGIIHVHAGDKLYKKRPINHLMRLMLSGFRLHNCKSKREYEVERCFYLETGNDHPSSSIASLR